MADTTPHRLTVYKKFLEVQKPFYKKVSGRRRQRRSGWAGLTFFELTDITVHPEEKMPGSISARRAAFFYSARAVGEVRCPSGKFKSPAARIKYLAPSILNCH